MAKTQKITTGTVDSLLPPEHHQAIGHVAAQWSIFEDFINLAICGLLGVSQRHARAITSQHSIQARLNMVRALAKEALPHNSAKSRFETIAKRGLSAAKDRNSVVHAVWAGPDASGNYFKTRFTGYGEVRFKSEKMTAADVEAIAAEISKISGDLYGFMLDHGIFPSS